MYIKLFVEDPVYDFIKPIYKIEEAWLITFHVCKYLNVGHCF